MSDATDLIIRHQANKRMVIDLAEQADIGRDRMYFNIARSPGSATTSAASIPLAIHGAVREGVHSTPAGVFTPAVVAAVRTGPPLAAMEAGALSAPLHTTSCSTDMGTAFGS